MEYYIKKYQEYFDRTFSVDPSSFLMPVVKRLPRGAKLLDVGCGSGRDLLWFKEKGFESIGFEKSPGLAKLAREYSGMEIIVGDFEVYDFTAISVDAIIASGSLVHVQHERFSEILRNIVRALENYQILYISLKQGDGMKNDDLGRPIYFWKSERLREIFENLDFEVLDFYYNRSIVNLDDVWLNFILRKRC